MSDEIQKARSIIEEQLRLTADLRAKIRDLECSQREPIAVVSMAMRFPGSVSNEVEFFDLISAELVSDDVRSEIPSNRPELAAVVDASGGRGKSYVGRAAFLKQIDVFDAAFFGISSREAEVLDPQQRLLLETAWEAFEGAGLPPRKMRSKRTGVFVGIMSSEYGQRIVGDGQMSRIDPYYATGGGHCFASGRISYSLGLNGPCLSVDTACSSSLVAVHLAVGSLRRQECDAALVGGANLILGRDLHVALAQTSAVSPSGRSKSFLADADGYGRGEGVGAVLLMRLSDAEAQGRPIRGIILGSATNHDGISSGLTVPNGPAQQAVIREALSDAGVSPNEVGYVEAHGTGTSLGDPIEVSSLETVFGGSPRRKDPLAIGSLKSRIGHLEAAAGIASFIKAVLCVEAGIIPKGVEDHDGSLNPLVPWKELSLYVPTATAAWPGSYTRRIAGISAFGMSGTNAHVVVAQPVAGKGEKPARTNEKAAHLVLVSAATEEALSEAIERASLALSGVFEQSTLSSWAFTSRAGRTHHRFRVAVTGRNSDSIRASLSRSLSHSVTEKKQVELPKRLELRIGDPQLVKAAIARIGEHFPLLFPAEETGSREIGTAFKALGIPVFEAGPAALATAFEIVISGTVFTVSPSTAVDDFQEIMAECYRAGMDISWELMRCNFDVFVSTVPKYPFQQTRFWIDWPGEAKALLNDVDACGVVSCPSEDEVYQSVTELLSNVLKTGGELDRDRAFVDAGGDSFAWMLLANGVSERFSVEIDLEQLLLDQTIGELINELTVQIMRKMEVEK